MQRAVVAHRGRAVQRSAEPTDGEGRAFGIAVVCQKTGGGGDIERRVLSDREVVVDGKWSLIFGWRRRLRRRRRRLRSARRNVERRRGHIAVRLAVEELIAEAIVAAEA